MRVTVYTIEQDWHVYIVAAPTVELAIEAAERAGLTIFVEFQTQRSDFLLPEGHGIVIYDGEY